MKILRFYLLALFVAQYGLAAAQMDPAGSVAKVNGKVLALRNPTPTPHAATGTTSQAKYKDSYWEAYDLVQGSPVYFGDLLSASPTGKTQLTLDSGFNVILAPNAKLRLRRGLARQVPSSTIVDLMTGSLRAQSRPEADESATEFRSRTMVMGVRGTDFSISALPKETRVVVVEGQVAVRNALAPAGQEVVLSKGEATKVTHPPEDQDVEALRKSMPAAEFEKVVAAYDPEPAAPATAEQAREIRTFSEGLAEPAEQHAVEALIEEKSKAEAGPAKVEDVAPQGDSPRRFAFELGLGNRSVNNGSGDIHATGIEKRLGVDFTPFAFPLAFGAAFAQTDFGPKSAFNDGDFITSRAAERAFGFFTRYQYNLAPRHALFGRLGLRNANLDLDGSARDGSHVKSTYGTGGLWVGVGYQFTVFDLISIVAEGDALPGSIKAKDRNPPDRDITLDPDTQDWGGGAFTLAVRITPF